MVRRVAGEGTWPGLRRQSKAAGSRHLRVEGILWVYQDACSEIFTAGLGALDLFLLHQEELERMGVLGRTKPSWGKEGPLGFHKFQNVLQIARTMRLVSESAGVSTRLFPFPALPTSCSK